MHIRTALLLSILLGCVTALAGDCERTLVTAPAYGLPSPAFASHLVAYDVDGDGRRDLVASRSDQPELNVLRWTGDGFSPAAPIPLPHPATTLFARDLDGDSVEDLIAAGPAGISSLYSKQDGTFRIVSSGGINSTAQRAAFQGGDMTGDGIFDVVLVLFQRPRTFLTTFAGRADGTFAVAGTPHEVDRFAHDIAVGEFTGDQKLDVALTVLGELSYILAGTGDGSFVKGKTLTSTGTETLVLTADFDGDRRDDIMISGSTTSALLLFLSTRSYESPVTHNVPLSGYANERIATDLDGDGTTDLIVGARVYSGNGDGTFTRRWLGAHVTESLAAHDWNDDGLLDFAARGTDGVWLHYGTGPFAFDGARAYASPSFRDISVADFNKDGRADVLGISSSGISVHTSDANGVLTEISRNTGIASEAAVVADFNNDGEIDVFTRRGGFYPGKGGGVFDTIAVIAPPDDVAHKIIRNVRSGDFNGDGNADIVAMGTSFPLTELVLLSGDGTGRFTYQEVPTVHDLFTLEVADLNGDGIDDLLTAGREPQPDRVQTVRLLAGRSAGGFASSVVLATGVSALARERSLAIGDVDGDSRLDFVVPAASLRSVLFFRGAGNGSFTGPQQIPVEGPDWEDKFLGVALADFTGDGRTDLAVPGDAFLETSILAQQSDGSFLLVSRLDLGGSNAIPADVNGDGAPDLIVHLGLGIDVHIAICRDDLIAEPPILRLTGPLAAMPKGSVAAFTVTLDEPDAGGTVTFYDGENVLGVQSIEAGRATFATATLQTGTHRITARYSGDGRFSSNVSGVVEQVVVPRGPKRRSARH